MLSNRVRTGILSTSQCILCLKFYQPNYLSAHYKRVHHTSACTECSKCNKSFSIGSFSKHFRKCGIPDPTCRYCNKTFQFKSVLAIHNCRRSPKDSRAKQLPLRLKRKIISGEIEPPPNITKKQILRWIKTFKNQRDILKDDPHRLAGCDQIHNRIMPKIPRQSPKTDAFLEIFVPLLRTFEQVQGIKNPTRSELTVILQVHFMICISTFYLEFLTYKINLFNTTTSK